MNDSIFKAYDIRGIYPTDINEKIVAAIGQAYVEIVKPKTIAVGRDVRTSSPSLQRALIEGLVNAGVDVVDIGLISTEELYFAVGHYGYDGGVVVTASHNPREYNGMKMVRKNAEPIAGEEITETLRMKAKILLGKPMQAEKRGTTSSKDVVEDFRKFMLSFIDVKALRPLLVVANPNFGFQGKLVQKVCSGLPITFSFLNAEPDGTFPKGRPDPFILENRTEFIEKIKKEKPDFGVTWDADADRVFFATGKGDFLEAYYMNALLAETLLQKYPKSNIVFEPRYIWAIQDVIKANGGKAIRSRVGHSFIKKTMREQDAIFCGEASGHSYFRDFFFADSGILPFLLICEMISKTGKSLEELVAPFLSKYFISGETSLTVADRNSALEKIKNKYSAEHEVEEFDNLIVEHGREWRFNVRVSNTEPLLRINVEGKDPETVAKKRLELLAILDKS